MTMAHRVSILLSLSNVATFPKIGGRRQRPLSTPGLTAIEVSLRIEVDPHKIGQVHCNPVCPPNSLFSGQGSILITVGVVGAWNPIRQRAEKIGLTETTDYLCVI